MTKNTSDLKERLKENKLRYTEKRQIILEVLAKNSGKHLNAEEIHAIVCENDSHMGIATVYRTLSLLEKLKLISRVYLDDGFVRYEIMDMNSKNKPKKLICEHCGTIFDIEEAFVELLEKEAFKNYGFYMNSCSIDLYGICKNCLRE